MDAIWLFLALMQPLPATSWLHVHLPPCRSTSDISYAGKNHFMATYLLLTLSPYSNVSGIGYGSKKLSKMAGNSASYPLNS